MKNRLIEISGNIVFIFLMLSCSNPVKSNLKGSWKAVNGESNLMITEKVFSLDDGDYIPEDYYLKGDTIYTSYAGNEPQTSFVVQKLDEHYLRLLGPDSVAIEFRK